MSNNINILNNTFIENEVKQKKRVVNSNYINLQQIINNFQKENKINVLDNLEKFPSFPNDNCLYIFLTQNTILKESIMEIWNKINWSRKKDNYTKKYQITIKSKKYIGTSK